MRRSPPTDHMDWRTWALRRNEYSDAMQRRTPWRAVLKAIFSFSVFSVILTLVLGLAALIYGTSMVTPFIQDTGYDYGLYIVIPVFVTLAVLSGTALLGYYYLVVAAIVASCAWVFLTSYKGLLKEITVKAKSREHSPLFDISGLVFTNVFLSVVIVLIAILLGAENTDTPVGGVLEENLFALANAPVWEEIIVRVLLIGVPLFVVDLVRSVLDKHNLASNPPVKSRPRRRLYSYILGGKFDIGIPEAILVLASATIFGYAHFLGGWGFWKVPAAAIGGVAFGYLFLRHGLAAAIVMHFTIDYMGMPSQVFGYSEVPESIILLLWLGLGFVFTAYYITRIGEFLTGRKFLEDSGPAIPVIAVPQPWTFQPSSIPQTYQYSTVNGQQPNTTAQPAVAPAGAFYGGYICPHCGFTQARWVDGKFQCLRCGKLA
jgi:membrane protease YdiL (CAAX protease family)